MAKQTKKASNETAPDTVDWSQYADTTGYENVSQQDLGIPFLAICQKGSPEYDEDHEDHEIKKIEGIQVGSIFDTVSRKILYQPDGEPVQFIPCYYQRLYVEWKPRNQGGGIVASYQDSAIMNDATRDKDGRDVLPNGNIIVTTGYFFGFYLDGDDLINVVLGLSSTQLKKARQILNLLYSRKIPNMGTPFPMYAQILRLSTIPEKNEKGSWRGWSIESGEIITDPVLLNKGKEASIAIRNNGLSLPSQSSDALTDGKDVPF